MFTGQLSAMLYVSDIKRSVEFYRDTLGFEFAGYWDPTDHQTKPSYDDAHDPAYASFQVGETTIGLHHDPEFEPGRPRLELHIDIEDADALYARWNSEDLEITEPKDEPWGARMFTVTDPDGHRWDFLEDLGDA